MKTIEEIKIELTLHKLREEKDFLPIAKLPANDEIREFICEMGPNYAFIYAKFVDKYVRKDTLEAVIGSRFYEKYLVEVPYLYPRKLEQ